MQRRITQGLIAGVLALLGCGGSEQRFGEFVGTWHYDAANGALNCRPNNVPDSPIQRNPAINKVFGSGIVDVLVDIGPSWYDGRSTCDFIFDVTGKNAAIRPDQMCTGLLGDVIRPHNDWRFTLVAANKAEEVGGAAIDSISLYIDGNGNPVQVACDYTLAAQLTRVSAE